MEVEICSDSADDSSCASEEAASGRRSQRVRRPSLCNSSDDYSTPPKRKKSEAKAPEQTIEEIYKQLTAVKAKSTSLETIYEQPKNFKDPSRNLMAGVKTRRSCVLAEFYKPSKFKLKARKEKAKQLKRLGVTVPTGDLISEAELQAALAMISEDEDEIGINKTSHLVNTSLILVSPKRDVYLPSPEVPLVSGSSFIVPDRSFIEDNAPDASNDICPEELYKISLPFLDEPSEKVDGARSRGRKSRRSGGLRDFHSSTLSFRKEAASTAKEPCSNANNSLSFDPEELPPSFKERISALVEKEEQDETPVSNGDEESSLQGSSSSSCRRSPMDIGLPSSPKDYSLKHASRSSKSPRKNTLASPPSKSTVNTSSSPSMNEQTTPRGSTALNCSPSTSTSSPNLLSGKSPSRLRSYGINASCISCRSSLKLPTLSPTRSSRHSKALKRVSSPPPPCPVCSDCNVPGTTHNNKSRGGGTDKRALNCTTENTTSRKVGAATLSKGLRSSEKQSNAHRGKHQVWRTGSSSVASAYVTAKRTTVNEGSRRPTSNKKSTTKRRVSGVMKTLYSSYLVHSSPEEEQSKSMNSEADVTNNTETNVLESTSIGSDTKVCKVERDNEHINESGNNIMQAKSISVEADAHTAAGNILVKENFVCKKNNRKRKFSEEISTSDRLDIGPLSSQINNLELNNSSQQTTSTATTTTPSRSVGPMKKGRRKTLDTTAIALNTSIQTVNSKPTTYSPICQMSQLSLSSPINQRNRSRTNHRRRSVRLQSYTSVPLEGPCDEEYVESEKALTNDERVPPVLNKSVVRGVEDLPGNSDEKVEVLLENVVLHDNDEEEGPGVSFRIDEEDDEEEKEISFKIHDSSGESETQLMTGGPCPVDRAIHVMSLASPVETTAYLPTDGKRKTRRSAVFTKDSFTSIVNKPIKDSKRSTTITKTKELRSTSNRKSNQVVSKLSPRSDKKPVLSSKPPQAASSKPRRVSTLKTGLIGESASSPPTTRARVVHKAVIQNSTQAKAGTVACITTNGGREKKTTDNSEIKERPVLKVSKRSSPIAKPLTGKSSSTETIDDDIQVEAATLVLSDQAPSTNPINEMDVDSDALLKESSTAITKENDDRIVASKLGQLDNNNKEDEDVEMNEIVASGDTKGSTEQLDVIESLVSPPAAAMAISDQNTVPLETNAGEQNIDKEESGSKVPSSIVPPSATNGSVATASLSPLPNPAVLVPAAVPSPAETKKAFYLINKYKPKFSVSSHPSLGLNYNEAPTNDIGSTTTSDGKATKESSVDSKKNIQRRKSSSFASGGGGRTCFAVHPALASCTTDVFAGRKMLFVPDKKSDGHEKTTSSAHAAFVSAVSKKLNDANLEPKLIAVAKGSSGKVSNSKVTKSPGQKGTKGVSPKGGKGPKGIKVHSPKGGKSTGLKKSKALTVKTGKGPSPKMKNDPSPKRKNATAVKKDLNPTSPAAVASGSGGSSNESPKLSRSPFGGKGKTKIMLNDLADQEAIFDAPSPTIERKEYIRTGLGGSTVSSLSPGPLLFKPGNAFSPPTLKPAQHIFPPAPHKPFSLPRSSTTPIGSTVSTTLVSSKLAAAPFLPSVSKLPGASYMIPKSAVVSDSTYAQITKMGSTVFPVVSNSVPSQSSVAMPTVPKVIAPLGPCASIPITNGHCPTASTLHPLPTNPLASSTCSASVHRPAIDCVTPASVVKVPSPAATSLTASSAFPNTLTQQQPPSTPVFLSSTSSFPSASSTLATPSSGVLNLNADSPLLSGMFNNAVGVRVGQVFANPKTINVQKDGDRNKLLPTFTVFHH